MAQLADYDFEIRYKPGRLNGDADGLSRMPFEPSEHEHTETVTTTVLQAVLQASMQQQKAAEGFSTVDHGTVVCSRSGRKLRSNNTGN